MSKGPAGLEGLNHVLAGEHVLKNMSRMLESELAMHPVKITGPDSKFGRGSQATRGLREGELVCMCSCFYYDNAEKLLSFLQLPGKGQFRDRIVRISGLQKNGQVVESVLIGLSQFANHYVPIRKSPNARLVYDPLSGFNAGSLKLEVHTRNAAGIAPGADVVINYGAHYDFSQRLVDETAFTGALDKMFAKQRDAEEKLKEEKKKNQEAQETADSRKQAEIDFKKAEEAKKKKRKRRRQNKE